MCSLPEYVLVDRGTKSGWGIASSINLENQFLRRTLSFAKFCENLSYHVRVPVVREPPKATVFFSARSLRRVPSTMPQNAVNLASARKELAKRKDEVAQCMAELKAAQELVAAGGSGAKTLTVSKLTYSSKLTVQ